MPPFGLFFRGDNYPAIGGFLETPELLEQPKYAARSAIVFWLDKKLYISADKGVEGKYIDEVSTVINRYDKPSFSNRRGFVQEAAKIFK